MDRALDWFIRIWIGFAILVNVLAIAGFFIADGFWGGLAAFADIYDPRNIWNVAAEVILLSPAFAAYWWKQRRQEKKRLSP